MTPAIDVTRGVGSLIGAPSGGGGGRHPIPTPVQREPLPPFDPNTTDKETGSPLPVYTTLPRPFPPLDDPNYMRADLWSLTIPGLPPIPGGAGGPAQERVLTYLWERYGMVPGDWQQKILKAYGEAGLRLFVRSWPDERSASGISVQQYVDDTKRIQDAGLDNGHMLRSKYYDDPDNYTTCDEVVDALVKINGIQWAAHAWEASLWMSPEQYRRMIDHDALRHPDIRWLIHLQEHYADFGPDGAGHSKKFWEANFAVGVRHLAYQHVTTSGSPNDPWAAGMMAARLEDVQVRRVAGGLWGLSQSFEIIDFERTAQLQFNNQRDGDGNIADELHGNLKGYENSCHPKVVMAGYGNGNRKPDGSYA